MSDGLRVALGYVAAALPVFPCKPTDKAPYTAAGFKDATTDPERIRAWWQEWPRAMIGLPTGEATGLFVLDVDIDKETGETVGERTLAELGLDPGPAPKARTASGGSHHFYRWPGDAFGSTTGERNGIGPCVDTRGAGGYVIAPGSVNGVGRYEWLGPSIFEVPPPDLPEQIARALEAVKGRKARRCTIDTGPSWGAGGQEPAGLAEVAEILNYIDPDAGGYGQWLDVLMGMHAHFRGAPHGLALAEDWSRRGAKFQPGEVPQKWASFEPGGGVGFGTLCDLARQNGADLSAIRRRHMSPRQRNAETGQGAQDGPEADKSHPSERRQRPGQWPSPDMSLLAPDRAPPPPFPGRAVFGETWGAWIEDAADAKGAPPDYVAASLLAVAGSLVGNARWVAPWSGWAEPPILWAMLVGSPSAGKSPALDAILSPLREVEKGIRRSAEAERGAWAERAETARLAHEAWKVEAGRALRAGKDIPEKPADADPGPEPHCPRLAVNDTTVEKLGLILSRQPKGGLVLRDELAGWLGNMSRYSNGGTDRPFWIEAYGGRSFTVERVSRDPVRIERLSAGVLGGIQPDRLKTLLLKADDDGLLARFLPVWPSPPPLKRPDRAPDEDFAERALARLFALSMPVFEDDEPRPCFVPFSEEARVLLQRFREDARAWEADASGLLLGFIGKAPGLTARLALVLAALEWATGDGFEFPLEIEADQYRRASALFADYLLPMAGRAYAEASSPAEERSAQELARMIKGEEWRSFTSRDVQRMKRAGLRDKREIDPALEVLTAAGWTVPTPEPTATKPRRLYTVNPAIWRAS